MQLVHFWEQLQTEVEHVQNVSNGIIGVQNCICCGSSAQHRCIVSTELCANFESPDMLAERISWLEETFNGINGKSDFSAGIYARRTTWLILRMMCKLEVGFLGTSLSLDPVKRNKVALFFYSMVELSNLPPKLAKKWFVFVLVRKKWFFFCFN